MNHLAPPSLPVFCSSANDAVFSSSGTKQWQLPCVAAPVHPNLSAKASTINSFCREATKALN
jgi:hypothetical protein